MHRTNFQKGFTLIEFMVAMSLVAILSSMAIGNFMGTQKRGRDVRRQSDLNQYRVALENWSTNNQGGYPPDLDSLVPNYLPNRITDAAGYTYRFSSTSTSYVLDVCLEVQKNILYEICSNGKSGVTALGCSTEVDAACDL